MYLKDNYAAIILLVKPIMEPDGKTGLEFGFGGGEDAGDEVVETGVGAAEAEDATEFAETHHEAAAVAPSADEPVETYRVFVCEGDDLFLGEGGVAVLRE